VTVPAATVAGSTIQRGVATVGVRAQKPGPEGNVEARDITQVPDFLRTQQVSVINPEATRGGKRDTFPQVTEKDVETALAQLTEQLRTAYEAALDEPTTAPDGATLFRETAVLGEATPTPVPDELVEQEIETFTLQLSAQGTVLAVDESPLAGIAASLVDGAVEPGHELVEGSVEPTVGPGTLVDGTITFQLGATAQQVAILDAVAIERRILGLPVADVPAELAGIGDARVEVWPDFVATIPTLDGRVEVVVEAAGVGAERGDATDEPVPSP
jgi:hypothetical protein